jgi:hypothetical protein
MRRFLVVLASLALVGDANAQSPMKEPSSRTRTWEMALQTRYQFEKDLEFRGGSTVEIDDDFAWGFAANYNVNEKINLGTEFGWNLINYNANVTGDPDGILGNGDEDLVLLSGTSETSTWLFNATWHLLPTKFTPFAIGGIGWGAFDSEISTGNLVGTCWWDPWYGYVCGYYPETYGDDAIVYRAGGGLRFDSAGSFFIKTMYTAQWNDFGESDGVPAYHQIRLEFGSMFQ